MNINRNGIFEHWNNGNDVVVNVLQ